MDNNSQVVSDKELRFNIEIPDNLIGNKTFFKFIVLVFLRDFEYERIENDFGQNPVHYFVNPSYSITIDLNTLPVNSLQSINNTYDGLVEDNLPPGFPQELKDSLKIEKIEYIYKVF